MSLKHILNDDPSPPLPVSSGPTVHSVALASGPTSAADSAPPRRSPEPVSSSAMPMSPPRLPPLQRVHSASRSDSVAHDHEQQPHPRGFAYHPAAYQGAGGWDPYTGKWVQGDIFPLGPGGNYYPDREDHASESPQPPNGGGPDPQFKDGYVDGSNRKKRKHIEDDEDYRPPGQKRVSDLSESEILASPLIFFTLLLIVAASSECSSYKAAASYTNPRFRDY